MSTATTPSQSANTIKILLIGSSGVGKSCLMMRFCFNEFSSDFMTTIGVDFGLKTINVDGKTCRVQLWDTAGQERFRGVAASYYHGAHAILVVFDGSDSRTFHEVPMWLSEISSHATPPPEWSRNANTPAPPSPLVFLLINKADQIPDGSRKQILSAAQNIVREQNLCIAMFTSAKSGEGVDDAFREVTCRVMAIQKTMKPVSGTIKLNGNIKGKKSASSCDWCGSRTRPVSGDSLVYAVHDDAGSSCSSRSSSPTRSTRRKTLPPLPSSVVDRSFVIATDRSVLTQPPQNILIQSGILKKTRSATDFHV
eukprot:c2488_g1_i1.p1 GENE.c2488_g1_i1~~c2488_g1_i1.p1  ORF type:complete len:363 (+),score=90.02 c2488_g1_i1:161-1090(+)